MFSIQKTVRKKLLIENMENIWVEEILQLELGLQLLNKNHQIIEIIPLVDTVAVEKLDALINLLDILTQKLCFRATRKTSNKN